MENIYIDATTTTETLVDYFEINKACANVPIINSRILVIDISKVTINGGALARGHPFSTSDTHIIVTLINGKSLELPLFVMELEVQQSY